MNFRLCSVTFWGVIYTSIQYIHTYYIHIVYISNLCILLLMPFRFDSLSIY